MTYPTYLMHYGIKGQKWGVRRYQNEDGTYTPEGKRLRRRIGNGIINKDASLSKELVNNARRSQKRLSKKFNKETEKILEDKKMNIKPSDRRIRKVERLGTEFRKWDYIIDKPESYTRNLQFARDVSGLSALVGGMVLATPVSILSSVVAMKKINKDYADVFQEAKDLTIEDLKKHGII
jgi:hypothetical protein